MDEQEANKENKLSHDCKELIISLPREKGWITPYLYLFQGFWHSSTEIHAISTFQNHFQAKENYIVVASVPKSGTTWLKALPFTIVKRQYFPCLEPLPQENHEIKINF